MHAIEDTWTKNAAASPSLSYCVVLAAQATSTIMSPMSPMQYRAVNSAGARLASPRCDQEDEEQQSWSDVHRVFAL